MRGDAPRDASLIEASASLQPRWRSPKTRCEPGRRPVRRIRSVRCLGYERASVGTVRQLWRYPVKSFAGEALEAVEITTRGVALDRCWSVVGADGKLGSGKTTRRFRRMPGLLSMQSFIHGRIAHVQFPEGSTGRVDDPAIAQRVAAVVGEAVTLSPSAPSATLTTVQSTC